MNIIPGESTLSRIFLTVFLCVIAVTPLSPVLLLLGWRRLKHIPEDDPNHKALKMILYCGVVAVVLVGSYLIYAFTCTREGENEVNVRWLPPFATNVSYHRDLQNDAYEFDITEKNFKQFVSQRYRDKLKPVTAEFPAVITRYAKFVEGKPEAEHTVKVTDGLFVEFEVNKRKTRILYDRLKGRAYCCVEMLPQQ